MTAQQIARNARHTSVPFNEFPSIATIAVWLLAQLSAVFKGGTLAPVGCLLCKAAAS
jgi:hypothetical protein